MAGQGFEEIEHTADWALRVRGRDLDELLQNAAWGMLRLAGVQPGEGPRVTRTFHIESEDTETLLVTWLEELLYGLESRNVAYAEIHAATNGERELEGQVVETPPAGITRAIKAVTFHGLDVQRTSEGLEATIVFDV